MSTQERIAAVEQELATLRAQINGQKPPKPRARPDEIAALEEWGASALAWTKLPAEIAANIRRQLANPPPVTMYQSSSHDVRRLKENLRYWEGEASRRTIPASMAVEPEIRLGLDQPLPTAVELLEQTLVRHALERTQGRVEEAAKLLGISRKGLFLKRRRWGLQQAS